MTSTTQKNKRKIKIWAVAVWLIIWQAVSMWIGQEILLVSPVTVLSALVKLAAKSEFWLSIASSLLRIMGGFLLAVVTGTGLAAPCSSVTESPGISGTVYCDSEIYPGSFICDSCADLGIFAQSFCCHFLFNGISYYLYQCSGRDQPYGCSAERNGRCISDSCHAKSAVDLSFTDHALFPDRVLSGAGTMLEGRSGGGSDRYSPKLHRRESV